MRDTFRLGATAVIWAALTIILTSSTSNVGGSATFLLIIAGMFSTIAIWAGGNGAGAKVTSDAAEKAKRSSRERLARLVQQMDDEEVAQLSDLLSQNDDAARYNERLSR
jgi:hypothetical protein